jgi:hypothetical protein
LDGGYASSVDISLLDTIDSLTVSTPLQTDALSRLNGIDAYARRETGPQCMVELKIGTNAFGADRIVFGVNAFLSIKMCSVEKAALLHSVAPRNGNRVLIRLDRQGWTCFDLRII